MTTGHGAMRAAMTTTFAAAILAAGATPAAADLAIDFIESAPKDRFVIRNAGGCPLGAGTVAIDLAGSLGKLIFDTTGSGAGVEVFQPFELVRGADRVEGATVLGDGDTLVTLRLNGLAAGEVVAFTVDVDDTLAASELGQIRVTGAEIEGAAARAVLGDAEGEARFDQRADAVIPISGCVS